MGTPDPLLLGKAPAPVAANHPRSPLLAGLLALICPGLGHFYCGAVAPALIWSVTPHLAIVAMMSIGVFDAPHLHLWLGAGIALWIGLRLVQAAIAWRRASRLRQYRLRSINNPALYLGFLLGTSIFTSLLSVPFREFVIEPFKIPSASMQPSLAIGDQFFVLKQGPYSAVHRGDVVVYYPPEGTSETPLPFVGRVMGLGGDGVEVRNSVFIVNSVEAPIAPCAPPDFTFEDHGLPQSGKCFTEGAHRVLHRPGAAQNLNPVSVPEGHLFIAADHRENAIDSREFGTVPASRVVGRVAVVWLSLDEHLKLRPERIGLQP